MFGEIDYSLPNPHGSSHHFTRFLPGITSSNIPSFSSNYNWRDNPLDLFNNFNIMPGNDTALLASNLSNSSSTVHENIPATDEAPDHLLYIIIPLYSLVFIIGTIGNVLVILTVVTVKQMRNTTNALILHLAIANLSFVLMCIPHTIYVYVVHSYNFPRLLCKLANTLMYLSAYVSIYILVLMSIDRFIGVVYAVKSTRYRTERNVHLAVVFVWLIGIIFSSPNMYVLFDAFGQYIELFFFCRIYYDVLPDSPNGDVWVCLFRGDISFLNTARRINAYFFALLGLIVPLIVIVILYGLIINVLRKNAKGKQVAKGKKRVTKMISAVISSFVICWTPMQIYLLCTHHNQVTFLFAIVAQSLVYISACVNPILYAFLSEPFRQAFQKFLTCSKFLSNHLIANNDPETGTTAKNTPYRSIQERKSLPMRLSNQNITKTDIDQTTTLLIDPCKSNRSSN